MNSQDEKEYLDEREGIRQFSGDQSEFAAVKGAEDDLKKLLERQKKQAIPENKNKYGYGDVRNNPFEAVKAVFDRKGRDNG